MEDRYIMETENSSNKEEKIKHKKENKEGEF